MADLLVALRRAASEFDADPARRMAFAVDGFAPQRFFPQRPVDALDPVRRAEIDRMAAGLAEMAITLPLRALPCGR
ncbi:MAG: hypothetical protein ACOY41_06700 [Pseudomonadota bacterium]